MFGTLPKFIARESTIKEYRRLRAYYRFVSGYGSTKDGVTVEQTGLQIEEGANIIE